MGNNLKPFLLFLLAGALFLIGASDVSASYYDWRDPGYGYTSPIYTSGHYYQPYTYGFSGWSYNRVYYSYHRPYYAGMYGGYRNYPGYYYPPGWTRYYTVAVWPVYPAYAGYGGYYW